MYSERILEHFEHPRNAGILPKADARVTVENPLCGDVLELAITIQDRCIQQSRFRAQGCVPLIACSSVLSEMIQGLTIDEAASIDVAQLLLRTGPLPQASGHAADMAIQVVRQLLGVYGGNRSPREHPDARA
jgi:nitrogen fixation protein NifU and related proteins